MTKERRREIENELLSCGPSIVLPVEDVKELLQAHKAHDPYKARVKALDVGLADDETLDEAQRALLPTASF